MPCGKRRACQGDLHCLLDGNSARLVFLVTDSSHRHALVTRYRYPSVDRSTWTVRSASKWRAVGLSDEYRAARRPTPGHCVPSPREPRRARRHRLTDCVRQFVRSAGGNQPSILARCRKMPRSDRRASRSIVRRAQRKRSGRPNTVTTTARRIRILASPRSNCVSIASARAGPRRRRARLLPMGNRGYATVTRDRPVHHVATISPGLRIGPSCATSTNATYPRERRLP